MVQRSHITTVPLAGLDLGFLPEQARQPGSLAFQTALAMHFGAPAALRGEAVIVTVDDETITIITFPRGIAPFDFGLQLLQGGQLSEGASFLESLAKETAHHTPELFYNLGVAYSELGDYAEAVIRLKRAVQLDPTHAHAWTALGVAYLRMGRESQALEPLQRAVAEGPTDGYANRNLGGLLLALGDVAGAIEHLRTAVRVLPVDAQALYGLGLALEASGDMRVAPEALQVLTRFEQLDAGSPYLAQARAAKSRLQARLGRAFRA